MKTTNEIRKLLDKRVRYVNELATDLTVREWCEKRHVNLGDFLDKIVL